MRRQHSGPRLGHARSERTIVSTPASRRNRGRSSSSTRDVRKPLRHSITSRSWVHPGAQWAEVGRDRPELWQPAAVGARGPTRRDRMMSQKRCGRYILQELQAARLCTGPRNVPGSMRRKNKCAAQRANVEHRCAEAISASGRLGREGGRQRIVCENGRYLAD